MKRNLRVLSLLMATAMILSLLAGCGKKAQNERQPFFVR